MTISRQEQLRCPSSSLIRASADATPCLSGPSAGHCRRDFDIFRAWARAPKRHLVTSLLQVRGAFMLDSGGWPTAPHRTAPHSSTLLDSPSHWTTRCFSRFDAASPVCSTTNGGAKPPDMDVESWAVAGVVDGRHAREKLTSTLRVTSANTNPTVATKDSARIAHACARKRNPLSSPRTIHRLAQDP